MFNLKLKNCGSNQWLKVISNRRFSNPTIQSIISKNPTKKKHLTIDFNNISFIDPFKITSLACLIEEYSQNGFEIYFKCPNEDVQRFLRNIRFYEYWTNGFDRHRFTGNVKQTSLCLWHINKAMIDSYVIQAQGYYEKNYFNGFSLDPLNISLAETINNIIDHSNSVIEGYTFTQFFPKINKIKTSLCDFGHGIPSTVKAYLNDIVLDNIAAMMKAFEIGFTVKSKFSNAGLGLDNLLSNVCECGGVLKIYSNDVYLKANHKGTYCENNTFFNFQGTLIEIELDTNQLELQENDFKEDFLY